MGNYSTAVTPHVHLYSFVETQLGNVCGALYAKHPLSDEKFYLAENKLYMLCSQIDYLERNKPVHKLV